MSELFNMKYIWFYYYLSCNHEKLIELLFIYFQTHALALTRPKSTPEESSISPTDNRESSNHSSIEISTTKSPKIEIGSPPYQQQQQIIADNLNRCNSNILTNNLNVNNRNENVCVQNGPEKLNSGPHCVERKENDFSKLNCEYLLNFI